MVNLIGKRSSQKFDDMREAIEHFDPLRARRVKSD